MATPDPRVTVVMITHDRRQQLLATLEHLQRLPERPRTIVVDNGSTDGTRAAVVDRFPGVKLVTPGRNLGAAGRNLGVSLVQTPYVAFADDDTWWAPGSLERAADLFDAHPRLAVVTARILVEPGGNEDPICADLRASPLPRPDGIPGWPLLSFLAGASMVRRAAFKEVGGFEAHLFLGGEEELLGCDLVTRGWAMSYVPEVVVHHHPSKQRDPHLRRRHGIRNTLWFCWLRRPLGSALRRTVQMAADVPKDQVSLGAFVEALAGLPWVLRHRRPVPPAVEDNLRLLEESQRRSSARRYVS